MIKAPFSTCLVISLFLGACKNQEPPPAAAMPLIPTWLDNVDQEVHKLGSYNWVIVADPSFPALSRSGVTTIAMSDHVFTLPERRATSLKKKHQAPINSLRFEITCSIAEKQSL